ncbi:hypothetical protein CBOM_04781 [Ceraceosorus bombacis]|uniref:Uncharacterized protein n=1 Tax=Ceraceosorus bombacis TaxID=401625 RepID=A0A0P1BPX0_9BASI|nr:hypothetical protein CBOM_04781 [Ceraceosorus bombacis]
MRTSRRSAPTSAFGMRSPTRPSRGSDGNRPPNRDAHTPIDIHASSSDEDTALSRRRLLTLYDDPVHFRHILQLQNVKNRGWEYKTAIVKQRRTRNFRAAGQGISNVLIEDAKSHEIWRSACDRGRSTVCRRNAERSSLFEFRGSSKSSPISIPRARAWSLVQDCSVAIWAHVVGK